MDVPAQDEVPEAGREPLDLAFDGRGHVHGGAVRDMTVCPRGVLPGRGARRIEQCVLDEQDVGPVRMASRGDLSFGRYDLRERAAEVNGRGTPRPVRGPGNRPVERPVHFEDAGAVAEPFEAPSIPVRQPIAGDRGDLTRGQVQQDCPCSGQRTQIIDPVSGHDLAAQRPQLRRQRIRDGPGTAAGHRPAMGMRDHAEDKAEGGRQRPFERYHRVGRDPAEQGTRGVITEPEPGEAARGEQCRHPEPREGHGMSRYMDDRPENLGQQPIRVRDERPEQAGPGRAVAAEAVRRRRDRSLQERHPAAVERMGDRRLGVDPLDATRGEIDGPHERRRQRHPVDGRAHVVNEAGQRELGRSRAPAGSVGCLVDDDGAASPSERDRGREAVGPRPDDDRVRRVPHRRPSRRWIRRRSFDGAASDRAPRGLRPPWTVQG